jgi:twitching motility protein PilI
MSATALQSLQSLERVYAREAIEPPEPEKRVMLWAGTSLSIAGVPVLVGEGEIDEIIETPVVTRIPGTKFWVLGVAAYKGSLLPIYSGDAFFRKVLYAGRPREYCMVIRRPGFNFGMTISAIERDLKFPIEQRDMECPIDPDFAELTLGGFHQDDKFLAVLDIDKLVADSDFSDASGTEDDTTRNLNDE